MKQVIDFFEKLLSTADWPPRWHCGHWTQFHGWLYIISDVLIWGAYFTIPVIIIKYITKKTDASYIRLYFLFAGFILACGATHFLDALTFWVPVYRLNALVKLITGIISWITVYYLFKTLPAVFKAKTNAELEHEIEQRIIAEEKVRTLNNKLERLIADKTNELIATEQKFGSIIEHSYDAILLIDAAFKPLYRNTSANILTGWDSIDPEDANLLDKTHPDDVDIVRDIIAQIIAHPGKMVSCTFRTRNHSGDYIWLEGNVTNRLNDQYIHAVVLNFRDITARKNVEEQLRKSDKIYREIAAHLPGSVVTIVDKDRNFVVVEGEGLERIGYDRIQMEGRPEREALQADAYKLVTPNRDKAFAGQMVSTEATINGVHFLTRYVPLRDEQKEVYAVMTISIDITDVKTAQLEVKALNESLERKIAEWTMQLEAVNKELESFSYSVSHDLRAPLRVINGYSDIMLQEYGQVIDEEGHRMLGVIKNNTVRMGILIDELLNLSRLGRQSLRLQETDMNSMVKEVIEEQQLVTGSKANITVTTLDVALCDIRMMRYVWNNLISNAIKYSRKVETPRVVISSYEQGDEIIFSVKDNGVGFDMQYVENLFGVFQRLHKASEFEGSGVGLALVQRILTKHNGRVWAEAEENKGATFYFSLPKQTTNDGRL